jgi:hypothetical protein
MHFLALAGSPTELTKLGLLSLLVTTESLLFAAMTVNRVPVGAKCSRRVAPAP